MSRVRWCPHSLPPPSAGNAISDAGAHFFAEALEGNLLCTTHIFLAGNSISDGAKARMNEAWGWRDPYVSHIFG